MKLILVLSIIAYGYADKLDRAYLPPANAASSGGSPGSLIAPGVQPEAFGQKLPGSGHQLSSHNFEKPITSQSGLSGNAQNNLGTATIGNTFNPNGVQNLVTSSDNGYGKSTGISVSSGSTNFAPGIMQKYSSNGFSASNQNQGYTGGQSASDLLNQGFNVNAQVYNQERPQAAAERNAEILKYINENNGESYSYSYETSNGISADESGIATNGVMAQGGYAYTGDDGKEYSVRYTADEYGYQAQGEHLPTPHPIPEEILKSIEKNAKAAAAGTQEGAYRPEEYESEVSPQQYNIRSGASYQSKQGQEQNQGSILNPTNQYQAINQGIREQNLIAQSVQNIPANQQYNKDQGFGQSNQGKSQQNNPGLIQESNQNYRPRPSQSQAQNVVGEKLINESPNRGSKFGQSQESGYNYNQPQNALQPISANQYRPQASSQEKNIYSSAAGSVFKGNQNNLKQFPNVNRPATDLYRSQQSQSQIGSGQLTASSNRPLSQIESTSFPSQSQQGKTAGQGYQYQPKQPSLAFNKPSIIDNTGFQNQGISNQHSFNVNNNQKQGPRSSFNEKPSEQIHQLGKQPPFGFSSGPIQDSQFLNTVQNGAPVKNSAGQSSQFLQNDNQPSFNYNQSANKASQYRQSGNQPSFTNSQPDQRTLLPSGLQGYGPNSLGQGPTAGLKPVQAPYQYNKPSQSFTTQPPNFLPLESQPSNVKPGQVNQNRSEKFEGPRQPPSFSLQEGYKY